MDVDRAIAIIETVLAPKALTPVQLQIIRGVIASKSYQEIITAIEADEGTRSQPYQISYVKETGANLWQSLSRELGCKVTKTNLVAVLLWYAKQPGFDLGGQLTAASGHRVKIDWGDSSQRLRSGNAIDPLNWRSDFEPATFFYGRIEELSTLTSWCLVERCRLISLLGMGGMGKTTLTGELVSRLKPHYDFVIWRSLLNTPCVRDILREVLQFLSPPALLDLPDAVEGHICETGRGCPAAFT